MNEWRRVSRKEPCPICGKPDWCTISNSSNHPCCMRVESSRPCRNGGYLHPSGTVKGSQATRTCVAGPPPSVNWDRLNDEYRSRINGDVELASSKLGVSAESLLLLQMGLREPGTWTFPMVDGFRHIVGIRLRSVEGRKWSERGSRSGCFVPLNLESSGPLWFVEGLSDAAAMVSLGLTAIGWASAIAGLEHCMPFAVRRTCIIIADNDAIGLRGAERLAGFIRHVARSVRITHPDAGFKDVRAMLVAGATRATIEEL